MFYINGSDTNWLVYADYLEDQDIDATHIREGVLEQQTNIWCHERRATEVGSRHVANVGSYFDSIYGSNGVGSLSLYSGRVGTIDHIGSYVAGGDHVGIM